MSNDGTYNGHRNYAYWNVALWIGCDEGLYNHALKCARIYSTPERAARAFVLDMQDMDCTGTRDGVVYTEKNVAAALEYLFEERYSDE